ncbi:MAG: FAD:protein FMN transferase [Cytophagales bacterium]|nr:FAD:protein FMN transferase [Bernardetiaceae bacterium]MDW8211737.1 FAD:protein FMN transferase [Cytophagales bacterium]
MTPLQKKNLAYALLLLALMAAVYFYRKNSSQQQDQTAWLVKLSGRAMGTTYHISYLDPQRNNYQPAIDSLLDLFNLSLSTYLPDSEISRFNKGDSVVVQLPFFLPVLEKSRQIYLLTEGAFNPTVFPLVQAWGFGSNQGPVKEEPKVDSLMQFVDFESIVVEGNTVKKTKKGVSLDFNAIAPGYGVDLVAQLLRQRGIQNYMVEIGGEVVCQGKNQRGETWLIGIDNPVYEEKGGNPIQAKIRVENMALATSGNYRKFYLKDGKRYAHTIDPKTGRPVEHNLLSATVLAKDCITADALATAFMVMGTEKARAFAQAHQMPVLLIYAEGEQMKTYISPALQPFLVE